jgi:hypothetical protein
MSTPQTPELAGLAKDYNTILVGGPADGLALNRASESNFLRYTVPARGETHFYERDAAQGPAEPLRRFLWCGAGAVWHFDTLPRAR